jgi:hypothetical protein
MSGYPRVTIEQIESKIVSTHYFTGAQGAAHPDAYSDTANLPDSLDLLTFCVLTLYNGHTIVGKSACVSAKNFDAALGRKYAREDAIRLAILIVRPDIA